MQYLHPIRLQASLHETIWGGRRLERDHWKALPAGGVPVGEAWETEVSTVAQNGPYAGRTLGQLVEALGADLLGEQAIAIFGSRFPLLAKFLDANAKLSVQVHPDDQYAARYEHGKLGKTEFWYILDAEPGACIVHGFKAPTTPQEVAQAINTTTLEDLLHEEPVAPGDVIFVPAGTVHAIGSGVLLYELQEYSDITYRMYDYGRLTSEGKPRELHIERSLDVCHYGPSTKVKMEPVLLADERGYRDRCLVACPYFVTREVTLKASEHDGTPAGQPTSFLQRKTTGSCLILSSLGAEIQVHYGNELALCESLSRGETMVLPAKLGEYRIEGAGKLLYSYVPGPDDSAWQQWAERNG